MRLSKRAAEHFPTEGTVRLVSARCCDGWTAPVGFVTDVLGGVCATVLGVPRKGRDETSQADADAFDAGCAAAAWVLADKELNHDVLRLLVCTMARLGGSVVHEAAKARLPDRSRGLVDGEGGNTGLLGSNVSILCAGAVVELLVRALRRLHQPPVERADWFRLNLHTGERTPFPLTAKGDGVTPRGELYSGVWSREWWDHGESLKVTPGGDRYVYTYKLTDYSAAFDWEG
jgi:hypothetical protein